MVLCDVCNASLLMNLALNGLHDSSVEVMQFSGFPWNANFHKTADR